MLRVALIALTALVLAQNRGCTGDFDPLNPGAQQDPGGEPLSYPGDPTQPRVRIDTTMGTIVVQLFPDDSPITVENFLFYVNEDHYDGSIIHRIVNQGVGQIIQGGGFDPELQRLETEDPIVNESVNGLENLRGTIAMARTNTPDSATDQWYINTIDNPEFDFDFVSRTPGYAVFGEVVYGLDVVDVIRQQPTENRGGGFSQIPVEDVIILRVKELAPDE